MKVEYILLIIFIIDFIRTVLFGSNRFYGYIKFALLNISFITFFINGSINFEMSSLLLMLILSEGNFSTIHFIISLSIVKLFSIEPNLKINLDLIYIWPIYAMLAIQIYQRYYIGIFDILILLCLPSVSFSPIIVFSVYYFLKNFSKINFNYLNILFIKSMLLLSFIFFKVDYFPINMNMNILFVIFAILITNSIVFMSKVENAKV